LRYLSTTPGSTDHLFTLGDAGGTIESASATAANALSFTNTLAVAHVGTANAARALVLSGSNTGNNTLGVSLVDNGTGAVALTKQGTGLWILNGASTYTGTTTVQQGTLSITGAGSISASNTIDIQSGATFDVSTVTGGYVLAAVQTLKGNGTLQGNATINGTVTPGASPGKLNVGTGSAITFALNSTFQPEVGKSIAGSLPTPGSDYDQLALANGTTTTISSGALLKIIDLPNVETGDVYTILDNTGTGTLAGAGNFLDANSGNAALPEGATVYGSTGQPYTISYLNNDVTLTAQPVPEPATLSLAGLAAMGLLARRRRSV
jgi:fibronectin-binding autotransporter adhesin